MSRFELQLLGSPRIVRPDGTLADLPRGKPLAMLCVLALERTTVSRADLAAMLWSTAPPSRARASIRQALLDCDAHRIGHGTRLLEDLSLERYIRDHRIPLEICLTSNVQTRVAGTFADHPVRRYFDDGVQLTLCTDNRLVSGTTVTDEYWRAHHHLGFTWDELVQIARMGFESAFLPWPEKVVMLGRWFG